MNEIDYNYKEYEKSLERILNLTEKDYWVQYVDINRNQVDVAKTYLWISAALLGAYTAVFTGYTNLVVNSNLCTIVLAALSFLLSIIAFGVCLYSIPARKGYMSIANPSWGEFSKKSYDLLTDKNKQIYIETLTLLIDRIDLSVCHNLKTNNSRAKLLRFTSWILVLSFLLAIACSISIISNTDFSDIKTKTMKENIMENENTTADTPSTPAPQVAPEKPNVTPPAGPIGSLPPNYTTHGLDPSKVTVRVTEGQDKK